MVEKVTVSYFALLEKDLVYIDIDDLFESYISYKKNRLNISYKLRILYLKILLGDMLL